MATVDNLDILIKAQADSASRSIERLVNMFDQMRVSVASLSGVGGGLAGTASAIQRFVMATKGIENINKADFTKLKNSINAVGKIDSVSIKNASESINKLVTAFSSLNGIKVSDSVTQVVKLAEGIKQLGYKSAGKAVENIPKLADAMADLMRKLSGLPLVSQNLIDMTNALAKLARTGGASGSAANSLAKSLGTYTNSTHRASKGTFSLASAIGKLYATYWLLFRAFRVLGKAIDISSQLTEVQNVVDVTFGEYSNLIDKMSETSITDFGMSELTVKQVASRFQAMGTAMGFTQGKMADMSVELTKLTADMASFYNLDQKDVAEDLQSIFTGQTRPLRQYGLDLTEATLKEWAMKQGLDANIQSMTQAEKTMLRYQYVMANTGAAQGDFQRTAGTWANQVRILKMNLEELGSVVGGTLINAFKPLVTALNYVMGKLIAFARVVSESLGAIFGWEFQSSGSGGVANDFEDLAGSADDLASGTGSASDNLGSAAKNAKKLKDYMLGIDELNVLAPDDSSNGGSGGSGGGAGGLGGGSSTDTGGQWVKTESIFEKYKSDLDTLYKLGDYIGTKLTKAMKSIDWDKVYEGAKNFGSGLAEFLNGLISPELFGATGTTIANALNTAIYGVLSFDKNFDFYNFGYSIATGVSDFLSDFDFGAAFELAGASFDGMLEGIIGLLDGFEYEDIVDNFVEGFTEFVNTHDWSATEQKLKTASQKILDLIPGSMKPLEAPEDYEGWFQQEVENKDTFHETPIQEVEIIAKTEEFKIKAKEAFDKVVALWDEINPFKKALELGVKVGIAVVNIKEKVEEAWGEVEKWWNGKKEELSEIKTKVQDFAKKVKEKWDETVEYWENKDILEEVKTTYEDFKAKIKEQWEKALQYWGVKKKLEQIKTTYEDFKAKVKEKWDKVVSFWNSKDKLAQVKTTYESFKDKISELWGKAVDWWNKYAKLPKLNIDFDFSTTSIKNAINSIIRFINTYIIDSLNKISIQIPTLNLGPLGTFGGQKIGFNLSHIKMFEDGGFPKRADLFWANENGVPELVGTMGGKTAVASGNEITGISNAVYATGEREASLLADAVMYLREIASKEMSVRIGDKDIARSNNRGQRSMGMRLINEI